MPVITTPGGNRSYPTKDTLALLRKHAAQNGNVVGDICTEHDLTVALLKTLPEDKLAEADNSILGQMTYQTLPVAKSIIELDLPSSPRVLTQPLVLGVLYKPLFSLHDFVQTFPQFPRGPLLIVNHSVQQMQCIRRESVA